MRRVVDELWAAVLASSACCGFANGALVIGVLCWVSAFVSVRVLVCVLSRPMIRNILCQSFYQLGMCLWLVYVGKDVFGITPNYLFEHGWSPTETEATNFLNTFIFNTFVMCQVRRAAVLLGLIIKFFSLPCACSL